MDDLVEECTDATDVEVPNPQISKEARLLGGKSGSKGYEKNFPKSKKDGPFQGNVQLVNTVPKQTDACEGACSFLPFNYGVDQTSITVRRALGEMADFFASPMLPQGGIRDGLGEPVAIGSVSTVEVDRVNRLWELRMCIDMLHESMETYETNRDRDILSTADETLTSVEETLRRIAEIGFAHGGSSSSSTAPTGPTPTGPSGATLVYQDPAASLLQAMRSGPDITHCLLTSRLGISGLLEAVLGELTNWRTQPSESDLQVWRSWDKKYELLARRVGRLPGAGGGALQADSSLAAVRRREVSHSMTTALCANGDADCLEARQLVCPTTDLSAAKTVCMPICGLASDPRK